ncbi:hypothetical protein HanIR_Chr13g0643141 [Helianthus annuus]|nr:hypothetical protein HanIR_Chr13g0643141 [Helianthus annuus]
MVPKCNRRDQNGKPIIIMKSETIRAMPGLVVLVVRDWIHVLWVNSSNHGVRTDLSNPKT